MVGVEMSEFWLILAFLVGFVAGWCALIVASWYIKREALSIMNREKQKLGVVKNVETKEQTAELMIGIKDAMSGTGEVKEKLTKIAGLMAQYPDASEKILSKVMRFL
jgi:lipopolysaccharide export LptBFGC system permease protein LptF